MINTRKIKARMVELGLTQRDLAKPEVLNCSYPTVSQKLNGRRPLTLQEAEALGKALKLTDTEYYYYFFAHKIA
ncbi:helix-turn-helix transcriptional regulator [uncultured Megasphaera sp.]|uniref:helix-turn-helix domain-containing protein n=1 Tax=uncultured Megasphaera sp. TaxID=165188 RepID=UPI00266C325B|nr:helix-turn-helix transcriptional regulator [uncultured Megasphaera sp.]MBS5582789.1 helix-turn-helix transcriptional regulator [Megasphaera sp.]